MTMLQAAHADSFHAVHLPTADDFDFWRDCARALIQARVPPDRIPGSNQEGAATFSRKVTMVFLRRLQLRRLYVPTGDS